MSDWCILRTAGRSTIKLAESLALDGFEVWTPIESTTVRIARRNARRAVTQPMMAGYVFARSTHAHDLLRLSRDIGDGRGTGPGRPNHPRFSLWLFGRGAWSIADRDMEGLRQEEKNARVRAALRASRSSRKKAEPFPDGVAVRVKDGQHSLGAFGGMIGRVVRSDAGNSKILFTGSKLEWTIRTSLLDLHEVGHGDSLLGDAAQDAER